MKWLVVFSVLSVASLASADIFDEKRKMMKWMKHKAMEGCYGEEAMNIYMVKNKQAMSKCSKMEIPDLILKQMQQVSPYRLIQALMMGHKDTEEGNLMKLMASLRAKEEMKTQTPQINVVPIPMMQQQVQQEDDFMMKMMKKMMFKKMMKKMMMGERPHAHKHHFDADDDEDDDEDDMEGVGYFKGMESEDEFGMENLIKALLSSAQKSSTLRRSRRATDAELLDLGDKLSEKLKMQMAKHAAKMGNATCMLKELKMIDGDKNLDLNGMLDDLKSYNIKDEWFLQKNKKVIENCYFTAENLPNQVLKECIDEKWGKIKMFCQCAKMEKVKLCMNYDIKKKLEEQFGPLSELEETTNMEEKLLLPLTKAILDGDDDM